MLDKKNMFFTKNLLIYVEKKIRFSNSIYINRIVYVYFEMRSNVPLLIHFFSFNRHRKISINFYIRFYEYVINDVNPNKKYDNTEIDICIHFNRILVNNCANCIGKKSQLNHYIRNKSSQ